MEINQVTKFRIDLENSVFSYMEMTGQGYSHVMNMPIQRFYNHTKWKSDLEKEKQKMLEKEQEEEAKLRKKEEQKAALQRVHQ